MSKQFRGMTRSVTRVISSESFDLYLLAASAFLSTILGISGISSLAQLASLTLGLLAALSLSQIRSRHQVASIVKLQRTGSLSLMTTDFSPELSQRRCTATDVLLIGISMSRVVHGFPRDDLRRVLLRGGRIRVLLLDPSNEELLTQVARRYRPSFSRQHLKARISGVLDELASLRDGTSGSLEIRVAPFAPAAAFTVIDAGTARGYLVVQHYEHKPAEEAAPIISLERKDGFWFSHFLAEAERMWADATLWPSAPGQARAQTARVAFLDSFGAELEYSMSHASELLITGVARNVLLKGNYGNLEKWLRGGCDIRFLLLDPAAQSALAFAADRYYAERSPDTLRERIGHSLRLLDELQRSTSGRLSVRLTSHPLAAGLIAIDSGSAFRSAASTAFVEFYTYRTVTEPKIILTPADGCWYDNALVEAEALWANAASQCQR